jgi:hypothetical protein
MGNVATSVEARNLREEVSKSRSLQGRIARHPFMTSIGVTCVGMTGNTSESLSSGNNRWRSQICASTVR